VAAGKAEKQSVPEQTCNCGYEKNYDLPVVYRLEPGGRVEEQILDGTLLNVVCPACETELRLEYPLLVEHEAWGGSIALLPEADRRAYLAGGLDYAVPPADRIVIGFAELAEKVRIYRDGLNDAAVEVLKYYLVSRGLQDAESAADLTVTYQEAEGTDLRFTIGGLRPDELGQTRIPRDVYTHALEDLDAKQGQEPFRTFLTPPYVSVGRILSHAPGPSSEA
jgi:hypothetical protein